MYLIAITFSLFILKLSDGKGFLINQASPLLSYIKNGGHFSSQDEVFIWKSGSGISPSRHVMTSNKRGNKLVMKLVQFPEPVYYPLRLLSRPVSHINSPYRLPILFSPSNSCSQYCLQLRVDSSFQLFDFLSHSRHIQTVILFSLQND